MKTLEEKITLPKYIEDMHEDPMTLFISEENGVWEVGYSSEHGWLSVKNKNKLKAIQEAKSKMNKEWWVIGSEEVEIEL